MNSIRAFLQSKDRTWLVPMIMLLAAVLLRVLMMVFIGVHQPLEKFSTFDSSGYVIPAVNMLERGSFSYVTTPPYLPDVMRTPGYPWFLAIFFFLFGQVPVPLLIGQAVVGGLAVLMVWLVAKEFGFPARVSFLAALLVLLDPVSTQMANRILTEAVFTTELLTSMWLLLIFLKRRSLPALLAAALLLGLAALTRPIIQYLPIFLIPVFLLTLKRENRSRWLAGGLLFLAISIGITSLWSARNYRLAGVYTLSTVSNVTLLDYRARPVLADAEGISQEEASSRLAALVNDAVARDNLTTNQKMAFESKVALDVFRKYPKETLKMLVKGTAFMLFDPGFTITCTLLDPTTMKYECFEGRSTILNSSALDQAVSGFLDLKLYQQLTLLLGLFVLGVTYLGAAAGVIYLVRNRSWLALYMLLGIVLYFVVLSMGGDINYRFRVPFFPYLAILAGVGINWVWTSRLRKSRP